MERKRKRKRLRKGESNWGKKNCKEEENYLKKEKEANEGEKN